MSEALVGDLGLPDPIYLPKSDVSRDSVYIRYEANTAAVPSPGGYGILHYLNAERARPTFDALAQAWELDTLFASSFQEMFQHVNYRQIVSMGRNVVPLLLEKMKEVNPSYWHVALAEITKEDPTTSDDLGNMQRIAAAWLAWGKSNHYI